MSNSGGNTIASGGDNSGGGDNPGSNQPEYTEEQKADRADVTKGLSDQTNMGIMERWGKSSLEDRRRRREEKEKDQKCMFF